MEAIYNTLKAGLFALGGWVSSAVFYFIPIHGLFIGLSIAFGLSFVFGIIAGLAVQEEELSKDKAFKALFEIAVYFILIAALFVIGDKMNDASWVYEMLSVITWGMIYFYIANLTKNLKRLLPQSRGMAFLYYILNLEFIKRFPHFKDFEDDNKQAF